MQFATIRELPMAKDVIDGALQLSKIALPSPDSMDHVNSRNMEAVKQLQAHFASTLDNIINDFPQLDDLHGFYSELFSVLFGSDHYKLAFDLLAAANRNLAQLASGTSQEPGDPASSKHSSGVIDAMCTELQQLDKTFRYLEQVRQHLQRMPTIDPNGRTLLLCGAPNVGKSTFMNSVTEAAVDVQKYPFTTKSLHVGRCDFQYMRVQVVDTPGLLNRPLESRNSIEMQSLAAMKHLNAVIVFLLDASESCGFTLREQVDNLVGLSKILESKPMVVAVNKSDLVSLSQCDSEEQERVKSVLGPFSQLTTCCATSVESAEELKNAACQLLLDFRLASKLGQVGVIDSKADVDDIRVPAPVRCESGEGLAVKEFADPALQQMLQELEEEEEEEEAAAAVAKEVVEEEEAHVERGLEEEEKSCARSAAALRAPADDEPDADFVHVHLDQVGDSGPRFGGDTQTGARGSEAVGDDAAIAVGEQDLEARRAAALVAELSAMSTGSLVAERDGLEALAWRVQAVALGADTR